MARQGTQGHSRVAWLDSVARVTAYVAFTREPWTQELAGWPLCPHTLRPRMLFLLGSIPRAQEVLVPWEAARPHKETTLLQRAKLTAFPPSLHYHLSPQRLPRFCLWPGSLPMTSDLYLWLPHSTSTWVSTGHLPPNTAEANSSSSPKPASLTTFLAQSMRFHPSSCSGQNLVIIFEHQEILTLSSKDYTQNLSISLPPWVPPHKHL